MRNVIAAVMASTLALSAYSQAAEVVTSVNWLPGDDGGQRGSQSHMFDGISLTEQQRQQLRDLMQRARHDRLPVNVSEMETMHVTAENFDENAVRAQAEKMAQEQVARQVEMAKVRNQMYHLLTPEQQAVLNAKHQQRMDQLREVARMQKGSAMMLSSSSNTLQPQ